MKNATALIATGALFLAALCLAPQGARADPLPMLDNGDRLRWTSVGRVNGAGYRERTGCTGTLIAPDLVVTAAHCTGGRLARNPQLHFVAGWYRGQFTAHRRSAEIIVHPLYPLTEGATRRWNDIALIRLSDPIPRGLVAPVPLVPAGSVRARSALLLGYQNRRPHALSGQAGCPALPDLAPGLLVFGCEVVGGTSGGPVIVDTSEGPALAAIIVARRGAAGDAVAVPVSDWIREHRDRAQARHPAGP